jgi:hypothetical protein
MPRFSGAYSKSHILPGNRKYLVVVMLAEQGESKLL